MQWLFTYSDFRNCTTHFISISVNKISVFLFEIQANLLPTILFDENFKTNTHTARVCYINICSRIKFNTFHYLALFITNDLPKYQMRPIFDWQQSNIDRTILSLSLWLIFQLVNHSLSIKNTPQWSTHASCNLTPLTTDSTENMNIFYLDCHVPCHPKLFP